jgi:hypothetical protein
MPTSGEVLFARYAYPPNELGYCGPPDPEALMEVAGGRGAELRLRAQAFDGAWVYLEIIAAATGLDPLDPRVVQAYWVGNELLDVVNPAVFTAQVRARFASEHGADWGALDGTTAPVAHHSFQVFTIYPWVRLLHRGPAALNVLDRCRIRAGEVLEVDGDLIVVRSQPLTWDGHKLQVGQATQETARWAEHGQSLLASVAPGDTVALHWNWVCDQLSPAQATHLNERTTAQLDLTNRMA